MKLLESPCMVVSDAEAKELPQGFAVFTTPTPKYFWLNPLLQHLPFDLVSGYIAAMKGETAFRDGIEAFQTPLGQNRLKNGTEITIV